MTGSVMVGLDNNDQSNFKLRQKQRRKNMAMLFILFGWAIMLYVVAILKMGGAS